MQARQITAPGVNGGDRASDTVGQLELPPPQSVGASFDSPGRLEPTDTATFQDSEPRSEEPEPPDPTPHNTVEAEHSWLRVHHGQWQRKVLINNLSDPAHTQYNGQVAWAPLGQLNAEPRLVAVDLVASSKTILVSSAHLFLIGPHLLPRPIDQALVMIEVWITPKSGATPVLARLVVDGGCQLEGVLSSDFV